MPQIIPRIIEPPFSFADLNFTVRSQTTTADIVLPAAGGFATAFSIPVTDFKGPMYIAMQCITIFEQAIGDISIRAVSSWIKGGVRQIQWLGDVNDLYSPLFYPNTTLANMSFTGIAREPFIVQTSNDTLQVTYNNDGANDVTIPAGTSTLGLYIISS
ncbi:MAG: hypothetical protein ACREHG_09685 [Candidatus Saccharimonadales bacterium]